ncbi:hypothetical protein D3C87_1817090 [compost metagenome]
MPKAGKGYGRSGCEYVERVEQAEAGMAIVERALLAGPVIAIVLQEGVEAGCCFRDDFAAPFVRQRPAESGQQDVLRAPGRPIVHRLVAVPHPPEMG